MVFTFCNVAVSTYIDRIRFLLKRPFTNTTDIKVDVAKTSVSKPPLSIPVVNNQATPLFALIVGINRYSHLGIRTLNGAVADANSVQHYLEDELNVPNSQIRNLRNEEATRAAIIEALCELQNDSRIKRGDPILIYYAGHGGETDAPIGWEAGGSKIQMLVPHDFCTKINDREVHGIPDRTFAALLDRLSKEKGDNITVVFDCCHSGSGTRTDGIDPTRLARVVNIPSHILANVDEDIWRALESNRGTKFATGFLQSGLLSHVLLAACDAKEQAKEENGRGIFTKAFLEVLTTVGADKLTYTDLLKRIHALPGQNPQCEGYNQNRIFFNSRAPSPARVFYTVRSDGDKYDMDAGAVHGITDGAEFAVYRSRDSPLETSLLGTLVVLETREFGTTLDVPQGATRFALPQPAFALQTKQGIQEDLRLHVVIDEKLTGVFEMIAQEMQRTGSHHRGIILVNKDNAELNIALEDDYVIFNLLNPLVTQFGLTRMPFHVSPNFDGIYPVVCASAHYSWLLRHTSKKPTVRNRVRIEFTQVKLLDEVDDDFNRVIQPDGPNLNRDGVVDLIVNDQTMYGVKIVNDTDLALYPSLFFFDNSDLSITSYYQPPTAGNFEVRPPISPRGSLTIGYGSGGSPPFNYFLREEQNIDVGFLKLFLTTEHVDFSNVPQLSPFNGDNRGGQIMQLKPISLWDSILVTVVQRRGQVTKGV